MGRSQCTVASTGTASRNLSNRRHLSPLAASFAFEMWYAGPWNGSDICGAPQTHSRPLGCEAMMPRLKSGLGLPSSVPGTGCTLSVTAESQWRKVSVGRTCSIRAK